MNRFDNKTVFSSRWDSKFCIHEASKNSQESIVKLLLESGADPNAKDDQQSTPLHHAMYSDGAISLAKMLIQAGADINAENRDQWTSLHIAAKHQNTEMVQMLVHEGADVHARERENWTPLHVAAKHSSTEMVKKLIDLGADIFAKQKDRWMPLLYAVYRNSPSMIRVILTHGGRREIENKEETWYRGKTPLGVAIHKKRLASIVELVKSGASTENVGDVDINIKTAIERGNILKNVIEGERL